MLFYVRPLRLLSSVINGKLSRFATQTPPRCRVLSSRQQGRSFHMICYYELGADKRLNDIVMAGSHDAGITGGGSNVQTQDLDIGGQASAGVRLFDLRIAGASVTTQHGTKQVTLK